MDLTTWTSKLKVTLEHVFRSNLFLSRNCFGGPCCKSIFLCCLLTTVHMPSKGKDLKKKIYLGEVANNDLSLFAAAKLGLFLATDC